MHRPWMFPGGCLCFPLGSPGMALKVGVNTHLVIHMCPEVPWAVCARRLTSHPCHVIGNPAPPMARSAAQLAATVPHKTDGTSLTADALIKHFLAQGALMFMHMRIDLDNSFAVEPGAGCVSTGGGLSRTGTQHASEALGPMI